ncbi:MAG: hypothetical protein MJ191_00185 [Clostridium sp.]|nr:hypothetical protein [Clostridium sp.]
MPTMNSIQDNSALEPKSNKKDKETLARKEQDKCPIKIETLQEYWDLMKQHYARDHKRMKKLEQVDSGDFWKAIKAKFPEYQILPDTNFISYVKNNLVASLYTVMKSASILPTSDDDKQICTELNIALDRIWSIGNFGQLQFQAGSNAALFNVGYTQVGWDETLTAGTGDALYKGNVTLKNINPIKFMRDPFAISLETAGYCCTYDKYHKSVFEENKAYSEQFKYYVSKMKQADEAVPIPQLPGSDKVPDKDYYTLTVFWVKEHSKLYEIHIINNDTILTWKEIKPAIFPIVPLYCEDPGEKLVGVSPCAKVFANNSAFNIMQSLALTAEFRNQRPPKFVSNQAGLNIRSFSKYGDDPDKTFIVNGDASKAVHYQEYPAVSSALPGNLQNLMQGIEMVSGVDQRYTGRDTGSIITTGGTEEMLNRVTMIDTPKIMNYESYTKQLTRLVLLNLLEYAPKRKYMRKKPGTTKTYETVEIDFPNIPTDTLFDYEIMISSDLPKNKQKIAEAANYLMEKQMQYNQAQQGIQLITEEEWLQMQDLPFKEQMLERMGLERINNAMQDVSQVLFQYADLVSKGVAPEDAMAATAETLDQSRRGMEIQPDINNIMPEAAMAPEGAPLPTGLGM